MKLSGAALVVLLGAAMASNAVTAHAQTSNDSTGSLPSAGVAPKPTASNAGARTLKDSYAAIPLGERIAIQLDLVWAVNFTGPVNGEYSDQMAAAVRAFQRLNKTKQTGILNPAERAALTALVKPMQDQ